MTDLDLSKPVQTRDGRPVEIKFTDGRGTRPIAGYIGSSYVLTSWRPDGASSYDGISSIDLVNVPETVSTWRNIYPGGKLGRCCTSRSQADEKAGDCRVAVLRIDLTGDRGYATVEAI